jgi:uncharacterized protein (TIGR02687 family)
MNLDSINQALRKRFAQPLPEGGKRHVVFWYDEGGAFKDSIPELDLNGVKVWGLEDKNYFQTKRQLEYVDLESHYLIYAPFSRPAYEEDWLLDIYLYSQEFSADKVSLIMNELGIADMSLKEFIKEQISFFDSNKRLQRLMNLSQDAWDQEKLELAMLAVACGLKTASFEMVVLEALKAGLHEEDNLIWKEINKWPGGKVFWKFAARDYGVRPEHFSLKKFFLSFLVTSLANTLKTSVPESWQPYINDRANNCLIFLDHWMNNRDHYQVFDRMAGQFEDELQVRQYIVDWSLEEYLECDLLEIFDKGVLVSIINTLVTGGDQFARYLEVIKERRKSHWYSYFVNHYEAVEAAIGLLQFHKQHPLGIPGDTASQVFTAYADEYYQIDQLYRHFYHAFDQIKEQDILKRLQVLIENLYNNSLMRPLAQTWVQRVEKEMIDNWRLPLVKAQKDFFQSAVAPMLNKNERVFVLISDAMRFEVARELTGTINREGRGNATLTPMLGVVPSYTALGMASLLPGKTVEFNHAGKILVDGKEAAGLEQRKQILQSCVPESIAMSLDSLLSLSREEGRNLFKNCPLVYIYHDYIDAVGDKAVSEHRVFEACQQTIQELQKAVITIVNKFNGTNIMITSDHGFLYQREALAENDKLAKPELEGIFDSRRFVLAPKDNHQPSFPAIKMDYILGEGTPLQAIVPHGLQRFKVQGGGANYVHGGASLQEVVIPLIQFRYVRPSRNREGPVQKVDVQLTNTSRKITNNTFTFHFFQTEKVDEKRIPRRLRAALWDFTGERRKVSDEKLLIADRSSDRAEDRSLSVRLTLGSGPFDRNKDYFLLLIDDELNMDYSTTKFTVNLGIINDFDDF